ncbi:MULTISPECIES: PEPxxWA-CTERM sorting domain-containing protein [Sphingomonas]|uniref:PEPxxWA-CTERM sorting domain-containing protein n=1 Tax=Sphingomonas TaxID=13687 RepID=UPI00286806E6|nr:PEPxxWA-CTERM sorting domain-containing protein [Sphingomonas sp. CGMCC 1.13658]
MKASKLAALAALGIVAAGSSSAQAGVFTVTYSGIVSQGFDLDNYFGAGIDVYHLDYTMRFTIDPGTPGSYFALFPYASVLATGPGANPFIESSLTINNRSLTWSNSRDDGYDNSSGKATQNDDLGIIFGGYDKVSHTSIDFKGSGSSYDYADFFISSAFNQIVNSPDLRTPLDYDVQQGDVTRGYFRRQTLNTGGMDLNLQVRRITIAPLAVTPVPEPASWAMMIAGFAVAGAACRRRRAIGPRWSSAAF